MAKVDLDKDQLLCHFFEAVNLLYPPAHGEGIEVMTLRLFEVKKKITQLDPRWKLADSNICRVYKILSYLEKMDTNASFAYNHALSLKICQDIRLMTKPSRQRIETKRVQVKKKLESEMIMAKKSVESLICVFKGFKIERASIYKRAQERASCVHSLLEADRKKTWRPRRINYCIITLRLSTI